MSQLILLGIDMDASPTGALMVRMAGNVLAQLAPSSRVLLLTVIPVPFDTPASLGRFRGQAPSLSATATQRAEAERALHVAQTLLINEGIPGEHLEVVLREGVPAEELVKVATERQVGCLVLGHRGFALRQRLRRLVLGSITAQVLRRAPCPVLLISLPSGSTPLVTWYEEALAGWLSSHPSTFFMFTPEQVAIRFPPVPLTRVGRKEVRAAKEALQRLAHKGVLICQQVNGIWQCFND